MQINQCFPGMKVIYDGYDQQLKYKKAVVLDLINSDEVLIKFDVYENWFDDYEDLRTGTMTTDVANLKPIE